MKTLFSIGLLLSAINAFAAEKIECRLDGNEKAVVQMLRLPKDRHGNQAFNITLDDKAVGLNLVSIEDRIITEDQVATADKLSDWDGSSGVDISFRKGFLAATPGAQSKAFLKVYYIDGLEDEKTSVVECKVTE